MQFEGGREDGRLTKDLLAPLLALSPGPLNRVPVLGPMIENVRWSRLARPIEQEIETVLASREPCPSEKWATDSMVQRAASAILTAIREEMSWTCNHFRPDDDGAVAFWECEDGLDFTGAVLALEDELGFFLTETDERIAHEVTLGAFAERLAERLRDPVSAEEEPSEREGDSRPGCGRRFGGRR